MLGIHWMMVNYVATTVLILHMKQSLDLCKRFCSRQESAPLCISPEFDLSLLINHVR